MNKLLKLSVSVIVIAGLLIGCSESENSGTNQNKEEVKSSTVAAETQKIVEEQEKDELFPYETSENFGEWITKSIKTLDEDLDDPRIEQSGNDEGFTYYLKSKVIFELQDEMEAWAEGKAIGEDMSNLFMLQSVISHLQFVRTSHLGTEGQAIEAAELAEQWELTPDDMRKAYKYMKQMLHDLDVAVNHGGEGKTYGVTHTLNGNKVSEMTRVWNSGGIPASELEMEMFVHGEDGVSAYESIEDYMKELSENWAQDSEFRQSQMDYCAEMQLAEYSLYETAYFENEIEEMGLSDLFEDLRQTAFQMVKNDYESDDMEIHEELAANYDTYLQMIIDESNGAFVD